MKRFPRTKAKGRRGHLFVADVVSEAGCIFREVPEETDVGVDGYIEFVDDEIATGLLAAVQIKAGSSYLVQRGDRQYFQVTVPRKDLSYWNLLSVPTALIFYDPETKLSGWLDITGYMRRDPEALHRDWTTLRIGSTARPLNVGTFQGEFKANVTAYRHEADLFSFAELMASDDPEDNFRGFLGLLGHPTSRYSGLTCWLLVRRLFHEDSGLRAAVSDALSRYLPHPEVGFVPPEDIRDRIRFELRRLGKREIRQLIETAWLDEQNLMQRGSLGQSVGVIIIEIPAYEGHLCELAVDPSESHRVRWGAIALAAEFGMGSVIKCVARSFDRVEWGEVYEAAQWAAEESARIEAAENDLSSIIECEGCDADSLAEVLRDASLYYLVENEVAVAQIWAETSNSYVRFEATRALSRIMDWQYPPEEYMEKLL